MINRFIAELNTEPKMPSNSYNNDYVAALDLSRRRDSVETRKTPSPYNTNSSRESASPQARLDHTSVQISSNSPNSSGYAASSYSSSTFTLDRPVPLHNQPYLYGFPPNSPSDRGFFLPHPNLSPMLHQSSISDNHIKEEPTYNPSNINSPGLHQQQLHMRISPPALTPPTEYQSKTSDSTVDQKPINPAVTAAVNTLPPMLYPKLLSRDRKISRPFKAYPRDPLAMAATFTATDALLDTQKAEKYSAFRKRMLEQIHASNGGRATISNPKMRRNCSTNQVFLEEQANDSSSGNEDQSSSGADSCNNPGDNKISSNNNNSSAINQNGILKDAAYYERRKKNNAAAKKSRDRRRIKEDEIAVRAAFLEHENIELRIELAALKNQLAMLTANR